MAWVQWVDNAVVGNVVYEEKGTGDNWRELTVVDQTCTDAQELVIVEEGGVLKKKAVDRTLTYVEKRVLEYPHFRDQLDMMYKDQLNGTTTWKDAITAIKEKYPKE